MTRDDERRGEVFAILCLANGSGDPAERVTVEEVVRTREIAEAEVQRLNATGQASGRRYRWQATRLLSFDEADGPGG